MPPAAAACPPAPGGLQGAAAASAPLCLHTTLWSALGPPGQRTAAARLCVRSRPGPWCTRCRPDLTGMPPPQPAAQVRKFDGSEGEVTLQRPVRALQSPVSSRLEGGPGGEKVGVIRLSSFNARAQVRSRNPLPQHAATGRRWAELAAALRASGLAEVWRGQQPGRQLCTPLLSCAAPCSDGGAWPAVAVRPAPAGHPARNRPCQPQAGAEDRGGPCT